MKKWIKALVFLALGACMLYVLTGIFVPKWISGTSSTYVGQGIDKLDNDSVEVGLVGSSMMVYGVSSMRLFDQYGISAYSGASALQPVRCSLYVIEELERKQNLKVVVFDASMLYTQEEEARFRYMADVLKLSSNKVRLVEDMIQTGETTQGYSYIIPFIQYHSRWKDLKKADLFYKNMQSEVFRGNILHPKVRQNWSLDEAKKDSDDSDLMDESANDEVADNAADDEDESLQDKQQDSMVLAEKEAFIQLAEYCKDKGIELLVIKTPKYNWTDSMTAQTQALTDEYDIPYIDFNLQKMRDEISLQEDRDMWDKKHMNIRGADKISDYLGQYLKDHYVLTDYREDGKYDEAEYLAYRQRHDLRYMQSCVELDEILELVNQDKYQIFIQKNGEFPSTVSTLELEEWFKKRGLEENPAYLGEDCYIACIDNGKAVSEKKTNEELEEDLLTADGQKVHLRSAKDKDKKDNAISVGNRTLYFEQNGINFLIYNKETKTVEDVFSAFKNGYDKLQVSHNYKELIWLDE